MNQLSTLISNAYGALLIVGGIFGYMKAHSKVSLITGLISGILVQFACKIGKTKPKEGYLFMSTISLILSIFFCMRFAKTHAFMPSGLMLILSAITLVIVGISFLKEKNN